MKDIDFLPIRYRERNAETRGARVRADALQSRRVRGDCCHRATSHAETHRAAIAGTERSLSCGGRHHGRADQLQKDLSEIERFAALYTYLRHPWPVTQLLNTLTEPLPDSIVITEITLHRKPTESLSAPPPSAQPTALPVTPAEAAKRDLDRLRSAYDGLVPVLHVTGITTDASNLHGYVSLLAPSPLFKNARIESLEAVASETGRGGSRFELRLQLRSGFGQPDGPQEPMLEFALASSASTTKSVVSGQRMDDADVSRKDRR